MPSAPGPEDLLEATARTTLRRKRERGQFDRSAVNAILDEALHCHVGFTEGGSTFVVPMIHARIDRTLYLHGAAANRTLRALADGTQVCVTVTLVDGLVLARSSFHHSMNYRSVLLFGQAERVTDEEEQLAVAAALVDHLAPGRSADARPPSAAERRATLMLSLPIDEGSAKVRTGGPVEEPEDLELPVWAGVIPVAITRGPPLGDPDLVTGVGLPPYLRTKTAAP